MEEIDQTILQFTFDILGEVNHLVLAVYHLNALSVRVVTHTEWAGNGGCEVPDKCRGHDKYRGKKSQ